MLKKEVIWREILYKARTARKTQFTQKDLAAKFGFSLSTVFHALKTPRQANAVRTTGKFFVLEDYRKLLYLWASERNLKKDTSFKAYAENPIDALEALVPPESVFGLYSGFKFLYKQAPADYDHLYIYLPKEKLSRLAERLMGAENQTGYPNIFVIEPDPWFDSYPQPLPEQIFVDIWNTSEWYAKDFLRALEEKLIL